MPAWRADLHVHTALSGCAEAEMLPPLVVERCQELGLTLLGSVDHNSAANCRAVLEAARDSGIVVKPGLEVETRETVHLVCLFDTPEQALDMQTLVYAHLPCLPHAGAHAFGHQALLDGTGDLLGYEERPLFAATDLSLLEAAAAVRARGGLVIASHVERRAHGLLGVLGFQPPELELDALEAGPGGLVEGRIASSDAHRLSEIGSRYTVFEAESASAEDLRACLVNRRFRAGLAV